jgi:general secretion pathway protein D
MKKLATLPLIVSLAIGTLPAQTIAEKKESLTIKTAQGNEGFTEALKLVNETLEEKKLELQNLYEKAQIFLSHNVSESSIKEVLAEANSLKADIQNIQEMWRKEAASYSQTEEYALWQQTDTTLFNLVTEYGSNDFLYIIPKDIGAISVNIFSSLPIPKESWSECLELILCQHGVALKKHNAYIQELYLTKNDGGSVKVITDNLDQLALLPMTSRACFILNPQSSDLRASLQFLKRFANPSCISLDVIAGRIFITGSIQSIQELVKLYQFSHTSGGSQETSVVTLNKLEAKQMETILKSAFSVEGSSLQVVPLESMSQSLFLTGSKEEIKKALKLIREVENQIEDPREKTVFWYVAKHSDAEELASVLARVYDLLTGSGSVSTKKGADKKPDEGKKSDEAKKGALAVMPASIENSSSGPKSHKTADGQNNFIVDPKTGAIIMVVEQEALPKIKELLKKLDIPKKMVQIEVLLFEKKISNQNNCGLNLLKLGSEALNKTSMGLGWGAFTGSGILEFFTSRAKGGGIPAYDLAYQFLMSQQDIQINASPSVTTMNQTPAKIAIVDEISIDSGTGDKKEKVYNRAQYGIVMEITPTINIEETEEGEKGFILLDTDITFDTTQKNSNDRPDVTRRHIKNHVRIPDGQTVILGGLRRKSCDDAQDSIPFLGEIPGIGKLFSCSKMNDNSTEMFVFITPKIINDPLEDGERIKREELRKRPGDVPELLQSVLSAKASQKKRLFEESMKALLGRKEPAVNARTNGPAEYEGR